MGLSRLRVRDLRVLANVQLEWVPGLNLITGPNASGKTSLLEAVHVLAQARSFRTAHFQELIRHGADTIEVVGRVAREGGGAMVVGVRRSREGTLIRVDGESVRSAASLAAQIPLVLMTPDSQSLIHGGPQERRRLVDLALFHVEPRYLSAYTRYQRALRQRNVLLKSGALDREIEPWEEEMARAGEFLHGIREAYVARLAAEVTATLPALLPRSCTLRYEPGWDPQHSLGRVFRRRRDSDRTRGFSARGPHRADLSFLVSGRPAAEVLSRGQSKLLVAAVCIAQARLLCLEGRRAPIVLVDDLGSELDPGSRDTFMGLLRHLGCQALVTGTEVNQLPAEGWPTVAVFHVEHGSVREMI